ncbi:MAG: GntR family transcriptional regulator [Terriglobales bacterium]
MSSSLIKLEHPQRDLLLVKDNLAAYFREEIINGRLAPGEKIVEVTWAKRLKISQTSVREALNILSAEGFVQKGSGRTAQVTQLSDEDVNHSYKLRAVLEGYAASVIAEEKPGLGELEQALADMRSAIECNNIKAFYERDLQFHILLAEKTGNPMLVQAIKRIILPLFAFVVMRVQGARTSPEQWIRSLEQHRRIIDALKTGDPVFAERQIAQIVGSFLEETKDVTLFAK